VARHEVLCTLDDVLRQTAQWLKHGGRACYVFPEKRRADFARAAVPFGFRIRRFRHVAARAAEPPNLFLVELGLGGGEPEIMPPLVLFEPAGGYTEEAEAIFAGRP
jgi:tRNA1Val (adenine37-N6)-methyltransferase